MNAHRLRSARTGAGLVVGVLLLAACGTSTGPTTSSDTTGTSTGSASPTPSTATDDAASPPAAGTADNPGNPGNPLYDVSSSTVDGADWDGADLAGKPAVLWFWAPWCPTCRAQVSGVGELASTHGDGVAVVGVGAQDDADAIAEFAASVDPAVTNLSDADGSVWRHYGVTAQSTYLVLDADGEVRAEGYLDEAELAGIVDDLVEQAG
ncbi:TlpA family protein disulfide reductase [Nocardioides salarius]|uniref:TlpA family protein disulfide reductase n=1 Tax=Nocardioides salarius TaxID=374513 RepID=UPI0030F785A4